MFDKSLSRLDVSRWRELAQTRAYVHGMRAASAPDTHVRRYCRFRATVRRRRYARESNTPPENFVGTVCRRPLGRTVGYYKGQWCSISRFRDSMSRAGENSRQRALTCTACVPRARPTRTRDDIVVSVRRNGVGGNARESNTPPENFVGTVCRRPLGRTVGYYKGQ